MKNIIYVYDARLTVEERNLLSLAYKNIINSLRNSWRVIDGLERQESACPESRRLPLIRHEKRRIEQELSDICGDMVKVNTIPFPITVL